MDMSIDNEIIMPSIEKEIGYIYGKLTIRVDCVKKNLGTTASLDNLVLGETDAQESDDEYRDE